ncbi:DUF805 domain-containing protein [Erwinia sorbitola]|uniref:DUF805 domain-containing protein n=1 Tax=Erwinia sorbitola TaxID=2681984 RepID=A0A6I6EXJ7_9GAMM|nr:DUF805 domain-containing protein [Erwinia sorbitola]MTD27425.1 DUF805 domain-containing protein [Erwinia sorbitola]QGU88963.1 DUF805 domain-containing protein [Erwinia sorbitola]
MSWYLAVLKNYAEFSGRARRKEYWMFILFNTLIQMVLMVLFFHTDGSFLQSPILIIYGVYTVATLSPLLAVSVRRLHDTNRPGWWMLLYFVPFGGIVILVILCLDGDKESNRFGAPPKSSL